MIASLRYWAFSLLLVACVAGSEAQTVYITKTGSKYHQASCRYLSYSKYPISLANAIEKSYTPCKVCQPTTTLTGEDVSIDSTQVIDPHPQQKAIATQCTATAKTTGNRCRRKTKNASGRCWQHE